MRVLLVYGTLLFSSVNECHVIFYFQGNDSSGKTEFIKDFEGATLMIMAETCFTGLINSVEDGTVKVATLKLLKEHSEQYLKLCKICQTDEKVETPIKASLSQRLCELDAFLELKDHLECFIRFCNDFSSGILIIILFQRN